MEKDKKKEIENQKGKGPPLPPRPPLSPERSSPLKTSTILSSTSHAASSKTTSTSTNTPTPTTNRLSPIKLSPRRPASKPISSSTSTSSSSSPAKQANVTTKTTTTTTPITPITTIPLPSRSTNSFTHFDFSYGKQSHQAIHLLQETAKQIHSQSKSSNSSSSSPFHPLTRLYYSNSLLNEVPLVIGNLLGLEVLNLSFNAFRYIPSAVIYGIRKSLKVLDTRGNNLVELPEVLNKCEKLERLQVFRNEIEVIQPKLSKGWIHLTFLDLSYNNIKELPKEFFTPLKSLTHLYLSGNKLTTLPYTISSLTSLTSLILSYNNLTSLPCLNTLTNVKEIDISFNKLSFLMDNLVHGCHHLEYFNASFNQLTQPCEFYGCENLSLIDLNGNPELTHLPTSLGSCPHIIDITVNHPFQHFIVPPPSILSLGIHDIKKYLLQVQKGAPDPRFCKVFGTALESGFVSETVFLIVQAVDSRGNLKTSGGDKIEVFVKFPSQTPTTTSMEIFKKEENSDTPNNINNNTTTLSSSSISSSSSSSLALNQGNTQTNEIYKGEPMKVQDLGNGTYQSIFSGQVSGLYTIHVRVGGIHDIEQSPFQIMRIGDEAIAKLSCIDIPCKKSMNPPHPLLLPTHFNYNNHHHLTITNTMDTTTDNNHQDSHRWYMDEGQVGMEGVIRIIGKDKFGNYCSSLGKSKSWNIEFVPQTKNLSHSDHHSSSSNNPINKGIHGMVDHVVDTHLVDHQNGTWSLYYTTSVAGLYQLSVSLNNESILYSPCSIIIRPGLAHAPSCSTILSTGGITATAGVSSTFLITSKDRFGNRRENGGDKFVVTMTSPMNQTVPVSVEDSKTGDYVVTFLPSIQGPHKVIIKLMSEGGTTRSISGSPFEIQVTDGTQLEESQVQKLAKELASLNRKYRLLVMSSKESLLSSSTTSSSSSVLLPHSIFNSSITLYDGVDGDSIRIIEKEKGKKDHPPYLFTYSEDKASSMITHLLSLPPLTPPLPFHILLLCCLHHHQSGDSGSLSSLFSLIKTSLTPIIQNEELDLSLLSYWLSNLIYFVTGLNHFGIRDETGLFLSILNDVYVNVMKMIQTRISPDIIPSIFQKNTTTTTTTTGTSSFSSSPTTTTSSSSSSSGSGLTLKASGYFNIFRKNHHHHQSQSQTQSNVTNMNTNMNMNTKQRQQQEEQQPYYPLRLIRTLNQILIILKSYIFPIYIGNQILLAIMKYIDAVLVNALLLHSNLCSLTMANSVRHSLDYLYSWIQESGWFPTSTSTASTSTSDSFSLQLSDVFPTITSALTLLQIPLSKLTLKDTWMISDQCPQLNDVQISKLIRMMTGGDKISKEILNDILHRIRERDGVITNTSTSGSTSGSTSKSTSGSTSGSASGSGNQRLFMDTFHIDELDLKLFNPNQQEKLNKQGKEDEKNNNDSIDTSSQKNNGKVRLPCWDECVVVPSDFHVPGLERVKWNPE